MRKIFLVLLCANLVLMNLSFGTEDLNADSKDLGDSTALDSLTIIKDIDKTHSTLSIRESYDKVLLNNDSLKASQSGVEKAQKLKKGAWFLFAPQIDIIGNYTYMEKTHIDIHLPPQLGAMGLPTALQMDLHKNHFAFGIINAIYPLYTGGKRLSALKMADLNIKDSEFILQLNKINLFEKLVKAYFGVKLSYEVYQTLHSVELGALAHLNNAKNLQEQGQIAKIEYLSARVEYDKAKNKAHEAKDALDIALLAFKTILQDEELTQSVELSDSGEILNLTLTSNLNDALDSTITLKSLQNYKDIALSAYPALKSLEIKKLQTKELSEIEFGNFLPTVGLYGGYVIKDNSTMLNRAIPSWFVGISAKMSLLSSSGRVFKYQASKIAQNEVDYLHRQAKNDILLLVETTYKEVLSAKESYKNHSSTIDLATENLNLQERAFINGMASTVQVSDARNQLALAKIESQNSQYAYAIALAKLYAITNDIENFWIFYEKQ